MRKNAQGHEVIMLSLYAMVRAIAVNLRFCRVCGQPFRPVRFDAVTCSTTCRMRKGRGLDLAYLTTLPPDQVRARRFVHETLDADIAVARSVWLSPIWLRRRSFDLVPASDIRGTGAV
jgi:hypothetical protein